MAVRTGIRTEVRMKMRGQISSEMLFENSGVADEMSLYIMLRGVGWKRNCITKSLERMQSMAAAASVLLAGADDSNADKSDRYMVARLMNTMGYTNGRISSMVQQFACRTVLQYEKDADQVRNFKTRDETVAEICKTAFIYYVPTSSGESVWLAKKRLHDQWLRIPERSDTKSALARRIFNLYGRSWNKHVSKLPSLQRAADNLALGNEADRSCRDEASRRSAADGNVLNYLHSYKKAFDRKAS